MKYTWNKIKRRKTKIEKDNQKSVTSEEINGVKTLIIKNRKSIIF